MDRVARSTADFARLLGRAEKKGWKVVVLDVDIDTTTAAGGLVVEVVSAAADLESRRIGERAKATHTVRKAAGQTSGTATIAAGEGASTVVTERTEGLPLGAIAKKFNDEDVPTASNGGHWYASTVSHVLRSVAVDEELTTIRSERR